MNKSQRGFWLPKIAKYNSFWIRAFEKSKIQYFGSQEPKAEPVFIIGAPRTGSTILYQILTNVFDVLYIDNLSDLLHRNIFFGFWLSDKIFKQRAHNCFTSKFGNTFHCGLRGPSECAGFWYRWLPKDRHYIKKGELSGKVIKEMRSNIYSIINKYDNILLIKNINASLRLGLLSDIVPDAKFIFLKRDPLFTAQSILLARNKMYNSMNSWWSLMPLNINKILKLGPHEQVVKQIYYIEKQIFDDSNYFSKKNFLLLNYEKLVEDSQKVIEEVENFFGNSIDRREFADMPKLNLSRKYILQESDISQLKSAIEKLDWDSYKS